MLSCLHSVYHIHEKSNSYFNTPTHSQFLLEKIETRLLKQLF